MFSYLVIRKQKILTRGFTLVEILIALLVIVIGIGGIMAMIYGSFNKGRDAADRNAAAVLMPEVIRLLEQKHLLTEKYLNFSDNNFDADFAKDYQGLFVETLAALPDSYPSDPESDPDISYNVGSGDSLYEDFVKGSFVDSEVTGSADLDPIFTSGSPPYSDYLVFPPLLNKGLSVGDIVSQTVGAPGESAENSGWEPNQTSGRYRFLYRLEKHIEWRPEVDQPEVEGSPFEGIYVLTIVCYRDNDPKNLMNPNLIKQITDPVVVYLRDRKVR